MVYKNLIKIDKGDYKLLIEVEYKDTTIELPDIEKIARAILDASENAKNEVVEKPKVEESGKKKKGRA